MLSDAKDDSLVSVHCTGSPDERMIHSPLRLCAALILTQEIENSSLLHLEPLSSRKQAHLQIQVGATTMNQLQ